MPKLRPQSRHCRTEQELPEPRAQQKRQIKPTPQLPAAQGKGAVQPHRQQLQTDQALTQAGSLPVEGLEHIRRCPQQRPLQKATHKPLPYNRRSHRRHPRRSRGSS